MRSIVIALVFIIPLATQSHPREAEACRPFNVTVSLYDLLAEPVDSDWMQPNLKALPSAVIVEAAKLATFSIVTARYRATELDRPPIYTLHSVFLI